MFVRFSMNLKRTLLHRHPRMPSIDYILDAAIYRFGLSAREVFGAIFNPSSTTKRHQPTFKIKYEDLETAVSAVSSGQVTTTKMPYEILAFSPVYSVSRIHHGPGCSC